MEDMFLAFEPLATHDLRNGQLNYRFWRIVLELPSVHHVSDDVLIWDVLRHSYMPPPPSSPEGRRNIERGLNLVCQ